MKPEQVGSESHRRNRAQRLGERPEKVEGMHLAFWRESWQWSSREVGAGRGGKWGEHPK